MQYLHRVCLIQETDYASRNEQLNGFHALTHVSFFSNEVLILRVHIKLRLKIYV